MTSRSTSTPAPTTSSAATPAIARRPGRSSSPARSRRRPRTPSCRRPSTSTPSTSTSRRPILVTRTEEFAAAVQAGDTEKAKELYETARVPYERIEPVAESFGGLDPAIDARINDVVKGDEWTGFHPLEKALWIDGLSETDGNVADQLVADVKKLQKLAASNTYDPVQLANGAVELLNEVSQSKITGEEERYSHTDLTDFKANIDGAHEAFVLLEPALQDSDPELAKEIEQRFAEMYAELRPYQVDGEVYENYENVTEQQRQELSQAVDALAQPLAEMGGQIVAQ